MTRSPGALGGHAGLRHPPPLLSEESAGWCGASSVMGAVNEAATFVGPGLPGVLAPLGSFIDAVTCLSSCLVILATLPVAA
jgi:hypothetical protein